MNLEDFMDGEAFAYAPGHNGPFRVHGVLDGTLVHFVDDGGAVVLSGPADASLSRYEELGIGIHGWVVWKDGLPVVCKGDADRAARVSAFLAGLEGRKGVYVRQSMSGGDFIEPIGPYTAQIVTVAAADPAARPGLYGLVNAEGEDEAYVCAGAALDSKGHPIVRVLCRESGIFWHAATVLFPDADGLLPQKAPSADGLAGAPDAESPPTAQAGT